MKTDNNLVRVGVASWIISPNARVLLGRRKSSHGAGTWAPPGGHMEFGETPAMTAIRETMEETGIRLNANEVHSVDFTNDIFPESGRHYVTIHCVAYLKEEVPAKLCEPDKCEQWQWFLLNKIPDNLFLAAANFLRTRGRGFML